MSFVLLDHIPIWECKWDPDWKVRIISRHDRSKVTMLSESSVWVASLKGGGKTPWNAEIFLASFKITLEDFNE